jgi:hypothetical protein
VIRVTSAAARDDLELISRVDRGHAAAGSVALADGWAETGDIVVEASSPGFAAVQVTNGLRRSCRFVLLLIHFTPESLIFIFGASISETRMRPNLGHHPDLDRPEGQRDERRPRGRGPGESDDPIFSTIMQLPYILPKTRRFVQQPVDFMGHSKPPAV